MHYTGTYGKPKDMKQWMPQSQNWYERVRGKTFEKLRDIRSIELLSKDLKNRNKVTRMLAAEALGMTKDARAVTPLIQALEDRDWLVQKSAARALRRIGSPAVDSLIQALGNPAEQVRESVARVLGKIENVRAVGPLIQVLGDEEGRVRKTAAEALGRIENSRAIEPLIHTLKDGYWSARKPVAEALSKVNDIQAIEPLIQSLGDEDWFVREAALEALKRMGSSAILELIQALGKTKGDVRRRVAEALGRMGISVIKPLFQALWNAKKDVRKGALEAFGKMLAGKSRTHEEWFVREAAAKALGKIGDHQAVEQLILALRDRNWPVTGAASVAKALGKIGDPRAIEPLIQTLGHKNWFVGKSAAWALKKIGAATIEPLIKALKHENWRVRRRAILPLTKVCASIDTVIFGDDTLDEIDQRTTWLNPDVSKLTVPLSKLEKILIDSETYDFYSVERFITYLAGHVGQKRLGKHVAVYISGSLDTLHPNLYNALNNLCKHVECCKKNDGSR